MEMVRKLVKLYSGVMQWFHMQVKANDQLKNQWNNVIWIKSIPNIDKINNYLRRTTVFFICVIDVNNNDFTVWSNFNEKCPAFDIIDIIILKYGNA